MSKKETRKANRQRARQGQRRPWLWAVAALGVVGLVAGAFALGQQSTRAAVTPGPIGAVTECRANPPYIASLGFSNQGAFSTSERTQLGLVLVEGAEIGRGRTYQHPSWRTGGWLAATLLGRDGVVFTVPAPVINVLDNHPAEQNIVYRVDPVTSEMAPFADLPAAAAPDATNPYGALGLAIDCETDSLYVTSVAGSTREREIGRIFQLDAATGQLRSQLDNVDAIGVVAFNGAQGKRLYFGKARVSEIWSVPLDGAGVFSGPPRFEFSIATLGPRGDDRARRLTITDQGDLVVFGVEFSYNLVAPTEKRQTPYRYVYDAANDRWSYVPDPNTLP
jgi:hypothetical protein